MPATLLGNLKRLSSVLAGQETTSVNIDGGAIDGATIGANSAAAITGTTITGTVITATTSINGPTEDGSTASSLSYGLSNIGSSASAQTFTLPAPTDGVDKYISVDFASTAIIHSVGVDSTATTIGSTAVNADTIYFQNSGGYAHLVGNGTTNWRVVSVSTDATVTST